ncbi:MAG: phosphatidate cytidylyltransferase [Pseudomonadota bacterium]
MIAYLSASFGMDPPVVIAVLGLWAVLIAATAIVLALKFAKPGEMGELTQRTASWWWMIGAFTFAIAANQTVAIVFLALISYLALKEYLSLIPTRRIDRGLLLFAYLAVPIQYWWAGIDWYTMFLVFVPVWMFLFFPALMALRGDTQNFFRAVGMLSWGLMLTVFCLSHLAMLLVSGEVHNPVGGGAGLLFFVVVLTQFNDVAQYTWGKLFGRHKVTPSVSPNKTWEGLAGGIVTTIVLAMLIGPYLTPMDHLWSAIAGAVIGIAGFLGDINISAVKRDLGVKDSGGLIPGHGGILDRVDSLTYAAPAFFHFFRYFFTP